MRLTITFTREGGSTMSTVNEDPALARTRGSPPTSLWQRRLIIALTILSWLAIATAIILGIGKILTPLVLIGFSALLAYLIYPMVRFFGHHMPRILAIFVSLLLLLVVMGVVIFFIVAAAVQQFGLLINTLQKIIQHPEKYPQVMAVEDKLNSLGIAKSQIQFSSQDITRYLGMAISGIVPILGDIFLLI